MRARFLWRLTVPSAPLRSRAFAVRYRPHGLNTYVAIVARECAHLPQMACRSHMVAGIMLGMTTAGGTARQYL